jgi:hypothetical protein
MGQLVRLGGHANSPERPRAAAHETSHPHLLVGVLVTVITLALGVVLYAAWPRTPASVAARPASREASEDGAGFAPQLTEAQRQARQAERDKEDSAVFGQAPSALAYQTPSR